MSAKNGKAKTGNAKSVKSAKTEKATTAEDRRLLVLRALAKAGAISAEKAVAADKINSHFDFDSGNLLYKMRLHESPALVAAAKIDGVVRPRLLDCRRSQACCRVQVNKTKTPA